MLFNPSSWINVPAQHHPERICLKYKDRTFTYRETNQRANRLAWGLINQGLGKGTKIASLHFNCNESIEVFLALWKAGFIDVPLNTRNSAKENLDILKDAQPEVVLFGSEFIGQIEQMRKSLPWIKHYVCHGEHQGNFLDYETLLAGEDQREPDVDVDENDIYKIHYTSGTTGTPRGVIMTYRNRKEQIANVFMNADRLISKEDVFLHVAPLTHAAGYYSIPFFLKGAKHVILDKFDPKTLLETVEKEKVTCTLLVPTMIVLLLEYEHLQDHDFSSLQRIFYGTAPMPTAKLKQAISIFGNVFRQNYGLTEAVQPLSCLTPEQHVASGMEEEVRRLASAGKRAIGPDLRIIDDNDRDLPAGEVGEIILRGPHISPGYLNLPEFTAETYRRGWLHTGDLGYLDKDGYLFIVDRKKDMIISGGFNIYSREVEIFLDSHPAVLESAVIGLPDEIWGELVTAFVVLKADKPIPTEQELIDFCAGKGLTRYKLPKKIRFIETLPKNENGKIRKKDLKVL